MNKLYRNASVDKRAVDLVSRTFPVVASTGDVDSYDTILDPASWKLERYALNPVVLFSHDDDDLPIGTASNVRLEGDLLKADVTIVSAKAHPLADFVLNSVAEGALRGVSVGFLPGDYSVEEIEGKEVLRLLDNELYEISLTAAQSNANALIELRSMARGNMNTKNKKPVTAKRAEGQPVVEEEKREVPALSNYEDAARYISRAVDDVEGMPEDKKEPMAAAIRARMDSCRSMDGEAPEEETMRSLLRALDCESAEEAIGAVAALKQMAQVGLENKEAQERKAIIEDATKATKITPAQLKDEAFVKSLNEMSIVSLRSFVKTLRPQLPVSTRKEPAKPATDKAGPDLGDKRWSDLKSTEKAWLLKNDPEQAKARGYAPSK